MGTIMKNKTIRTFALQATVALSLVASSYANAAQLLNSSYDIAASYLHSLIVILKPNGMLNILMTKSLSNSRMLALLNKH